jgi:hypothetical protein
VASRPCQPNNLLGCPGGQFIRTGERCGRCTYFWVMVGRLCLALLAMPLLCVATVLRLALYLAYLPFGLLATAVPACMGTDEPWRVLDPRELPKEMWGDEDNDNSPAYSVFKAALFVFLVILTIAWIPIGLAIDIVLCIPLLLYDRKS